MESNQTRAKRMKRETGYTVKLSSGKKRNIYFTDETQQNIILYNLEDNPVKKEKLYLKIYPILNKVAHNLIYKYKLLTEDITFSDLIRDTTTHLTTKLHRFDENSGSAFSFFSTIAFNYLVGRKILNQKNTFDNYEINTIDMPVSLDIEIYEKLSPDIDITPNEKINKFSNYLIEKTHLHFPHKLDNDIVNAILDIMINYDNINLNMNTKTLYFLVKEHVECENKDILRVIKRLRKFYKRIIFEDLDEPKQ